MKNAKVGWLLWLGVVVGCVEDGELEDEGTEIEDDDALRSGGGGGSGTGWGCRTCGYSNSPILGNYALEEFVMPGTDVPPGELRLKSIFDPNGVEIDVAVVGNKFVATKSGVTYTGSQTEGWTLRFEDELGTPVDVDIFDYAEHPSWSDSQPVATYTLTYYDSGTDSDFNLCPGMDEDLTSITILGGERYDGNAKTVVPGSSKWVTLACRGHALAKLRMMGYAPNDGYGSSPAQRQATLKMLTADYCGNGHSYTAIGTPLDWTNARGDFPQMTSEPSRLEAKWSHKGASCLDKPRHVARHQVACIGSLPKCSGDFTLGNHDWLTTLQ